jgi:hypothetical protein
VRFASGGAEGTRRRRTHDATGLGLGIWEPANGGWSVDNTLHRIYQVYSLGQKDDFIDTPVLPSSCERKLVGTV